MDKNDIRNLLTRYKQGTATPREHEMVEAFLLIAEKEEVTFTDTESQITQQRIWNKLAPVTGHRKTPVFGIGSNLVKAAAVCLVFIGLSLAGYLYRHQIQDTFSPIPMHTAETGPYEIRQLIMPDSTVVILAQNSRLSYPARYRNSRYATLSGKAFFKVQQNAVTPFTVTSGSLHVKVLGTAFEVADTKSSYESSVKVLNGKVQVSYGAKELAILTGNQQVRYDKFSGQWEANKNVNVAAATDWTHKQLLFEEVPLSVVLKTLQVYYGMKIIIKDNAIKEENTFSGAFERNETKKQVLDVICFSSGLSYTVTKDSTIIIK